MDVEREMEALAREARKKLEAERAQSAGIAAEAARSTAKATSLGTKLAGGLIALAAIWLAWTFVIAPLAKWAILIAIVVAIVWVVWKLTGGGRAEPEEPA